MMIVLNGFFIVGLANIEILRADDSSQYQGSSQTMYRVVMQSFFPGLFFY